MYTLTVSRAAALVALVALVGCSDATSPAPDLEPAFTAQVAGATTRQLTGRALFATDVPGDEHGFAIALLHPNGVAGADAIRHAVYLRRAPAGAPAAGEYAIVSGDGASADFSAGVVLDGDGDNPLLCVATSGRLRITTISDSRVRGSFTPRAFCAHASGDQLDQPIDVSGTFVATAGTIAAPENRPVAIGGATYVLAAVDGDPLPVLLNDSTQPEDGTRTRIWLVADTVRFLTDGRLSRHRAYRESMLTPGQPDDVVKWASSSGGWFRQTAAAVAVAWGWVTAPPPWADWEILRLRPDGLVRVASLPRLCLGCAERPSAEFRYIQR